LDRYFTDRAFGSDYQRTLVVPFCMPTKNRGNIIMRPQAPLLVDTFGRRIEYLRLSVTDRCDLRCTYCIPKGFRGFQEPASWLRFEEIERLISIMAPRGLKRVRLTGGEPLVRRDLPDLAARLAAIPGIDDLSLSTNATRLHELAAPLKAAGVRRVNVSLDSLRAERVAAICGRDVLDKILAGLAAAKEAGFAPIKINMVAMRGVNDDEIDDMVDFCMEQGFVLRLIEAMPMGATGRNTQYLDLQPVRRRLRQERGLVAGDVPGGGPARYMKAPDGRFSIGFITPLSEHFCATCNRVRLAADGTMYLCLGQREQMAFGPLLRRGASDQEIVEALRSAMMLKPERHEFNEKPEKILRIMAATGG
jgi:cyclic pyranopterin phosphate synthase